jgi:hypothetical protein
MANSFVYSSRERNKTTMKNIHVSQLEMWLLSYALLSDI